MSRILPKTRLRYFTSITKSWFRWPSTTPNLLRPIQSRKPQRGTRPSAGRAAALDDRSRRLLTHSEMTRKSARMVKHRAKQSLGQRSEFAARTDQEILERTEVARVK